jgi:exodeoxyribonuclease V
MTTVTSSKSIFDYLPYEATREQAFALYQVEEFVGSACTDDFFILRGAAGTGKTSLVKAIVDYLEAASIEFYLAAPTGRAAKILGIRTRGIAHTIHHTIYKVISGDDDRVVFGKRPNLSDEYGIYIIDEASMISDRHRREGDFVAPGSLLHDLIDYVKRGNQRNKIIFIGDPYQLPPVKESESVALQESYLHRRYRLKGQMAELSEVKRQSDSSPVLELAHSIRLMADLGQELGGLTLPRLRSASAGVRHYLDLYEKGRFDQVTLIAYAHSNVATLNQMVRERLGHTGLLAVGDQIMVNENWLGGEQMILKGEIGLVCDLESSVEHRAGLGFKTATIQFMDSDNQPFRVTAKIMLDTLKNPEGMIANELLRNLKADRMAKNASYRENPHPARDPYIGSLRLKYGHALTGYSAQGGEWNHVVMHPWFPANHYAYAYTAVTRARETLTSWQEWKKQGTSPT